MVYDFKLVNDLFSPVTPLPRQGSISYVVIKGYLSRHRGNFPHDTTLLKNQQSVTLQTNPNDQMPFHIPATWLLLHLLELFLR